MISRKPGLFAFGLYQDSIRGVCNLTQIRDRFTVRKTIRIVGLSLALVALLVFATGVVSDWHHDSSANDARCPYCHLGHQAPIQSEAPLSDAVLNPIASVPLPEDIVPATRPGFSQAAPRAPPSA
jgi:hypothetical protein